MRTLPIHRPRPLLRGFLLALALGASLAASLFRPAPAAAQVGWVWIDAIGYGGLGAALGVAASWERDYEDFATGLALTAGLVGVGVVAGAFIGGEAERAVERGETPGPAHRALVSGGSVLAGATLGALTSALFIDSAGEGTPLGSDEATFTLLAGGGAVLGGLFAWWKRDDLRPRPLEVAPSVDLAGGAGVVVRYRF